MQDIAGYTIVNDVSERAYQLDRKQDNGLEAKVVTHFVQLDHIL